MSERKPVKVVVVPVTGQESLEYQVRMTGGGQPTNLLVSQGLSKKMQQLLARDLFNFLRGIGVTCLLEDYNDRTSLTPLLVDDLKARATELFTTPFTFPASHDVPKVSFKVPAKNKRNKKRSK